MSVNVFFIADIPAGLRTELLQRKLNQCCVLFDFTDPKSELKQKDIIIISSFITLSSRILNTINLINSTLSLHYDSNIIHHIDHITIIIIGSTSHTHHYNLWLIDQRD